MRRRSADKFGAFKVYSPAAAELGVVVVLGLAVAGCAAPRSAEYMGISLIAGEAPAELQLLAQKAKSGDKQAQLDLGEHFEKGILVPVDLEQARRLYTEAAKSSARTMPSYVNLQGGAVMLPTEVTPRTPGLSEAQARLDRLNKKRDGRQEGEASQENASPAQADGSSDPR